MYRCLEEACRYRITYPRLVEQMIEVSLDYDFMLKVKRHYKHIIPLYYYYCLFIQSQWSLPLLPVSFVTLLLLPF